MHNASRVSELSKVIRSVTFLDNQPENVKGPPVHLARTLLLDHEPTAARVNLNLGWSIANAGAGHGTITSFCVHPEDCETPELDEHGNLTRWPTIAGRRVLAPIDVAWETVHARERHGEIGDWVRVHILVAAAKALPAPARIGSPDLAGQDGRASDFHG